jgi:acyl-CoA thioesterase I
MKRKTQLIAVGMVVLVGILGAAFFVQTFLQPKASGPIRVACVGDSITAGFEYPDDLWMMLGENYTVSNFGAGGASVSLSSGTPYLNQTAFQDAKQFQPNIVVILLGANDAAPENERYISSFVDGYMRLISQFQALASKPQVWIVKPPPVFYNGTGLSTEFFDSQVLPRIEQVAKEANLPIIDVYSAAVNHAEYFWDGVHPNDRGSQLIAQVVYSALTSNST